MAEKHTPNSSPDPIAMRLAAVRARITAAARAAGRPADSVHLLAVSKTRPAADLRAAYAAGQRAFGENYLQDALAKVEALTDLPDLEWHFIGRVQSNKTRAIATHFSWLHSLDRLEHARRLAQQRPPQLAPLQLCLQVNLSGEASKGGVTPAALPALAAAVAELPRLRLRGLMTLPDPQADASTLHATFRRLRELGETLTASGLALDTLSMGMSADLEPAIAEGATWVRVGTALFGPRE